MKIFFDQSEAQINEFSDFIIRNHQDEKILILISFKMTGGIQEFYKNKTIFITGASGFMGKVLLEKMLYSCSDLKEIFILMRPKRGKTGAERVQDFANIPVSTLKQMIMNVKYFSSNFIRCSRESVKRSQKCSRN